MFLNKKNGKVERVNIIYVKREGGGLGVGRVEVNIYVL